MNLNIKSSSTVIDDGTKEQLKAVGYSRSYLKTFFFHCVAIICVGIPYVLIYWHNVFGVRWQYVQCPIDEAQVLVLEVSETILFSFDCVTHFYFVGLSWPNICC